MFLCCSHPSKCISPEQRLFSVLSWKEFHLTAFKIKKKIKLHEDQPKGMGKQVKGV